MTFVQFSARRHWGLSRSGKQARRVQQEPQILLEESRQSTVLHRLRIVAKWVSSGARTLHRIFLARIGACAQVTSVEDRDTRAIGRHTIFAEVSLRDVLPHDTRSIIIRPFVKTHVSGGRVNVGPRRKLWQRWMRCWA